MDKVIQLIGNGDNAVRFDHSCKGLRLICNMPPFAVEKVYASVLVDFKMMMALTEGSLNLDAYDWILGNRPKMWMEANAAFYLKHSQRIKEFYLHVPKYAGNATNFNCGHMAAHYAVVKQKASVIHMYGFDSIFDHNMRSITDLYLSSDRGHTNNYRLLDNWRPIWHFLFKEFPDVQFVLYHKHGNTKIPLPGNVEVRQTYNSERFTK
jgi:hypothetical protein